VGSRRARWGIVVALALLLAALIPTTLLTNAASAQTPPLRISMFGDSVLLGAKEQLLAQFAGQDVTVDAVEDRSLLGAIELFRSAGPALGDVVVLDLGYNDSSDPAVFRGRIDDAMSVLAPVKRVIWLNQHDWGPGRAGMNDELSAAASRYPNLDVVDWNAEVAAHPEYVYGDAIHLTPAGQPAMAAVVREHFDRYVTSLTPTTTVAPTTTPATTSATTGSVAARARPTPTASTGADDGIDASTVAVVAGAVLLVVALVVLAVVARRRRRRGRRVQRRVSSSSRSAAGSVTGSRQAKRSHT
jgi:hypothetical protein